MPRTPFAARAASQAILAEEPQGAQPSAANRPPPPDPESLQCGRSTGRQRPLFPALDNPWPAALPAPAAIRPPHRAPQKAVTLADNRYPRLEVDPSTMASALLPAPRAIRGLPR